MVFNNEIPIKIESTDRRYMVMKTSDEKRRYFDYFVNLCDSFTPEFSESLFAFFMILDAKNYNLRRISETKAKKMIKEASMSSYHLFTRECYEKIKNITGLDLFNHYW